jgi:hypothetical protein
MLPSSVGNPEQPEVESGIILLSFNRRPAELQQVLLNSSLAASLVDQGIDVQPTWAGGAIVLVAGLGPGVIDDEFGTWNVAVNELDEPFIFMELQKLPYKIRPRLKPGTGRRLVPVKSELFRLSDDEDGSSPLPEDEANSQTSADADNSDVQSSIAAEELEVRVVRTFLHVRLKPASSTISLPNTV